MKKLIGNAIVGQSGGPTAAINATLAGVIRGVKENVHDGSIKTLYGMRNGVQGLLEEHLINLSEEFADDKRIDMLEHTPSAALGSCRKKLPKVEDDPEGIFKRLLEIFKKYDIRYFFYIGGNDSMDTVAKLSAYTKSCDYEMCIMGVPKTIDNDLVGTDHTPGFGSAAKYVAVMMQEIIRDCSAYPTPTVTIVEIMGRDAGWLTAASAVGRTVNGVAPDFIYLPERDFSEEVFFEDVKNTLEKKPNVIVAVSEGIHFADGRYVCEGIGASTVDAFGHKQLSGTARTLENAVRNKFGCKARSVEFSLTQRCAAHIASGEDIEDSVRIGREAVRAASNGVTREMMTYIREADNSFSIGHSDVMVIANQIKSVPDEFINERGNNVTDACCEYILPLIQGEATPTYKNGIPEFVIL